jgi:hypothetical protein
LGEQTSSEEAIEALGKDLYFTMERLDPDSFDWDRDAEANWAGLTAHQQSFYVHCVRSLLANEREILLALRKFDAPFFGG